MFFSFQTSSWLKMTVSTWSTLSHLNKPHCLSQRPSEAAANTSSTLSPQLIHTSHAIITQLTWLPLSSFNGIHSHVSNESLTIWYSEYIYKCLSISSKVEQVPHLVWWKGKLHVTPHKSQSAARQRGIFSSLKSDFIKNILQQWS